LHTLARPDTQFVDVLLPDLLSTPRGKLRAFDNQVTPLEYDWYLTAG
jgi:hypothetical protein